MTVEEVIDPLHSGTWQCDQMYHALGPLKQTHWHYFTIMMTLNTKAMLHIKPLAPFPCIYKQG